MRAHADKALIRAYGCGTGARCRTTQARIMAVAGLARSLFQRTLGVSLQQRLSVRLASGEAYVPEKPPVEGKPLEDI